MKNSSKRNAYFFITALSCLIWSCQLALAADVFSLIPINSLYVSSDSVEFSENEEFIVFMAKPNRREPCGSSFDGTCTGLYSSKLNGSGFQRLDPVSLQNDATKSTNVTAFKLDDINNRIVFSVQRHLRGSDPGDNIFDYALYSVGLDSSTLTKLVDFQFEVIYDFWASGNLGEIYYVTGPSPTDVSLFKKQVGGEAVNISGSATLDSQNTSIERDAGQHLIAFNGSSDSGSKNTYLFNSANESISVVSSALDSYNQFVQGFSSSGKFLVVYEYSQSSDQGNFNLIDLASSINLRYASETLSANPSLPISKDGDFLFSQDELLFSYLYENQGVYVDSLFGGEPQKQVFTSMEGEVARSIETLNLQHITFSTTPPDNGSVFRRRITNLNTNTTEKLCSLFQDCEKVNGWDFSEDQNQLIADLELKVIPGEREAIPTGPDGGIIILDYSIKRRQLQSVNLTNGAIKTLSPIYQEYVSFPGKDLIFASVKDNQVVYYGGSSSDFREGDESPSGLRIIPYVASGGSKLIYRTDNKGIILTSPSNNWALSFIGINHTFLVSHAITGAPSNDICFPVRGSVICL